MSPRKPTGMNKVVYTVAECAAMMGLSLPKLYELAKRKDFPSIRVGGRVIVPKEAFHRWLEVQATSGEKEVL